MQVLTHIWEVKGDNEGLVELVFEQRVLGNHVIDADLLCGHFGDVRAAGVSARGRAVGIEELAPNVKAGAGARRSQKFHGLTVRHVG